MAFAIFLCFGYSLFSVSVHIVPHAIDSGLSATSAASVLATMGGMSIVGNVILGSAVDRIGDRRVFIIGFILMAAALFGLTLAGKAWMLYLFSAIFGFAYGGCAASESPLVAGLFGLSSHGLILGVIDFGFTIGAAIGPFVAGYIFDVSGSYHLAFQVIATICIVGSLLAALLARKG
jgi:MFS family permease